MENALSVQTSAISLQPGVPQNLTITIGTVTLAVTLVASEPVAISFTADGSLKVDSTEPV
jgi:hypothetical protein